MKRRKHADDDSGGTWLNTYADMVTLLLTFFVVMYSMSTVNAQKFEQFVKAMTGTAGVPTSSQMAALSSQKLGNASSGSSLPSNMEELYKYIANYVKVNKKESDIVVSKVGNNEVYIKFSNSMMFKPDDAALTPSAQSSLSVLGSGLKNMESKVQRIQVEGYTATTNDQNSTVNSWVLSGERAANVVTYLSDTNKIKSGVFVAIGYGSSHPVASNATEAGRVKNRRVEIKIYGAAGSLSSGTSAISGTYDAKQYPTADGTSSAAASSS